MAQVRIDLIGSANSLIDQIGAVTTKIRDLQRSAADVYAMRGDAGMVGLTRQISAATAELSHLKDQFNQLTSSQGLGIVVSQVQDLDRTIKSASGSASVFKSSLGTMASLDDVARQRAALAAIEADKKRYFDQDTARMAAQAQAQKKALQDQSKELTAFYKQQEGLQKDQINFQQKVAPSSPVNQQLVEQKRQYDAATTAAERLGQTERRVQAETLAAAKAHQAERDALRDKITAAAQYASGSRVDLGGYDAKRKTFETLAGKAGGGGSPDPDAGSKWEGLSHSLRHVIALFDEFQRGQRGAMTASIGALLRDQAAINGLIGALATPWGMVAAAGIAAAVAIGIAFEQMWQRVKSVNESAVALALKGGGASPEQYKNLEAEFQRLKSTTNEWAGNIRAVQEELNKLPLAAQGASRDLLGKMAPGLAGPGGDMAKTIAPLVSEINKGSEAFLKYAEAQYGVMAATDGSNRTLREQNATMASASQQIYNTLVAIQKAHDATLQSNTAIRANSNSWWEWGTTIAFGFAAATTGGSALGLLERRLSQQYQGQKNVNEAVTQGSQAQRELNDAVNGANEGLSKQEESVARLTLLWRNAASSIEQAAALQNQIAKVDTMGASPGEQNRHRIAMDNIEEEAKKRQQDTEAQIKAAQARAAEILRTQTTKRTEAGQDPVQAGIDATSSEEYIKAQNEIKDAERADAKERVEIAKDAQRAIIQNEMIGTEARIAAQRENVRLAKQADADGIGSKREVAQEEIKLQTLIRQERMKTFQEARDNGRAEVELAKGNVAQIMAAYDKLRAAASAAGMPKAAFAQIDREEVRDLESAQQKAFSAATEFNSAQERLGNIQIAGEKARLGSLVAAHQISREEMAVKEAEYTQKVMEENEKRIQSELSNDNLTKEQKEKLFEHLAELYEKDAELQIQAQEKATQAVEAENKRREAIFTKTFDAIGSEGEKAIEGLFDRSKTHKEVIQQFAQSIVKSIATSAAGELSEIGGQKLGPMLGLTKEESKGGIGQVLGQSLFKAIGLEKEPAQDHLKIASDKMKSASEAQTKAAELQSKAAENLLKASEALTKFAGDRGVPGNFKEGTGSAGGTKGAPGDVTIQGDAPAQAQAAVTNSFSVTGEKLKNYCATLVNESLEKAGVTGSGSGLASSFKNYGTAVDPSQVRAGDVFYSPPSGRGDTGHVGFTTGPVSDGQVPVMSSHMQGDPSNPAGPETRSTSNLIFRRPPYDESGGSAQTTVKLDPSSTQQAVATGVKEGDQDAASLTQSAVDDGVSSGNAKLVQSTEQTRTAADANKAALDKNTSSVDKNTTQLGQSSTSGGGAGAGVAKDASSTHSGFQLLTQGLGIASTAAALFGSRLSTTTRSILGAVGIVSQLASFTKNLNDQFNLFGTATKAVTTATTLEQGAKTLNASATAVDTTAMQANAAASSTSGAGGILGSIFKLFAFSGGGVVPSAAGGMMVGGGSGGTLSLLHPEEMVLPAHLSRGLQGMINRGGTDNSSTQNVLNYNANVTGYHPYGSRSEFEGMLRNNSSAMMDFMRNELKNGSYR
jgi:hypothetical protein